MKYFVPTILLFFSISSYALESCEEGSINSEGAIFQCDGKISDSLVDASGPDQDHKPTIASATVCLHEKSEKALAKTHVFGGHTYKTYPVLRYEAVIQYTENPGTPHEILKNELLSAKLYLKRDFNFLSEKGVYRFRTEKLEANSKHNAIGIYDMDNGFLGVSHYTKSNKGNITSEFQFVVDNCRKIRN